MKLLEAVLKSKGNPCKRDGWQDLNVDTKIFTDDFCLFEDQTIKCSDYELTESDFKADDWVICCDGTQVLQTRIVQSKELISKY